MMFSVMKLGGRKVNKNDSESVFLSGGEMDMIAFSFLNLFCNQREIALQCCVGFAQFSHEKWKCQGA